MSKNVNKQKVAYKSLNFLIMKRIKLEAPNKDQLELSDEIKKVHLWLRRRSQEVGSEQAWEEHLKRKNVLERYAQAMKTLAQDHWSKRNSDEHKTLCRIEWTRNIIKQYFSGGLRDKLILKEVRRLSDDNVVKHYPNIVKDAKLKLLDVGSCYNPFGEFSMVETYAIDLCPASKSVKECNFLNVEICSTNNNWCNSPVTTLPPNYFDVVVFSLFLEYLPSPEQRLKACKIALSTLKPGGILIVITPDSNHESANSGLMKTWKLALAQIGFIRFKIEKLKFLYCMAFRKTVNPAKYIELPEHKLDKVPLLNIPQDFVNYEKSDEEAN